MLMIGTKATRRISSFLNLISIFATLQVAATAWRVRVLVQVSAFSSTVVGTNKSNHRDNICTCNLRLQTSQQAMSDSVDANMEGTYHDLAQQAIDAYKEQRGSGKNHALWIACTGGPGAGKTTLARKVAERICEMSVSPDNNDVSDGIKINAISLPMDGYHYTKTRLAELSRSNDESKGMNRRGAPWTFDAEALAHDLGKAKAMGKGHLNEYDRKISDPIVGAIEVNENHTIVIVEGNYLLLGKLEAELDNANDATLSKTGSSLHSCVVGDGTWKALDCPVPIGEEIQRWKAVTSLFDVSWFVAPIDGVAEQRRRLIERSLKTWTEAKTEAWGGGTARAAATKRAEKNDVRNAQLIECCRKYAEVVVDSI